MLGTGYYLGVIWNSLRLALLTTILALAIAYPAAFALARARGIVRTAMLSCLFLPLAASVIVKAFAWTILLRSDGIVNRMLLALHIVDAPIRMIFTETALIVGSVNIFLPFMILPIYAVVTQLDRRLMEAAATLGAPPVAAFVKVIVAAHLAGRDRRRRAGVLAGGLGLCRADPADRRALSDARLDHRQGLSAGARSEFGAAAGVVLLVIAIIVVSLSARLAGREASR